MKKKSTNPAEINKSGIKAICTISICLISPFILLNIFTKAAPQNFINHDPINIGEFCGVCHMGSNDSSSDEYANMKRLGAQWTRVDFKWNSIQPKTNLWSWDYWDSFLSATEEHNVSVLALLLYDNDEVETVESEYGRYIHPDDFPLFLEYVNRTVRRYKDRVGAWEIWNEPNEKGFWAGPFDHFLQLFNATKNLIHDIEIEFQQNLTILSSAMSYFSSGNVPVEYEAIFQNNLMKNIDTVALHLYSYDADYIYRTLKQQITMARKYEFKGSFWITEIGNPTGGQYAWRVSQKKLADNIIKMHTIAITLGIEKLIWYHDTDSQNPSPTNSEGYFGLFFADGSPKPGAFAYSLFSNKCIESSFRQDLIIKNGGLTANDLRTALYRKSDGKSILIMWYDPTLYLNGSIAVQLNLQEIGDIKIYDIYTGVFKNLESNSLDITGSPTFIEFESASVNNPIQIKVNYSWKNFALYSMMFSFMILGTLSAILINKKENNTIEDQTEKVLP